MVLGKGKNPKDSKKITPPLVSEFDPEDNEKQKDDESLQIVDEEKVKGQIVDHQNTDVPLTEQELEQFNETLGFLENTVRGINRNLDESRGSSSFIGVNFLLNHHQQPQQEQPNRSESQTQTNFYPPFHYLDSNSGKRFEGSDAAAIPNYRHIMLKPEKK